MTSFFETLTYCPLFSDIKVSNFQDLLECLNAMQRKYTKNESIFSTGDHAFLVGIMLSGSINVLQEDYWGNRTILAHIESGGLFAESFSCAEIESLPVSVIAAEDTEILLIDYKCIIKTCSNSCPFHTQLIQNMLKILAKKNIELTQKMEIITHRTTRERLLAYLSSQAIKNGCSRFSIPFNRQELADYLSVERSAMSAELSKMQSDDLIWTNRSEFELFL